MKKLFIIIALLSILTSCKTKKVMEPDTPTNAAWLMKFQIDQGNYDAFQSLFYEDTGDQVSKEKFQNLKEITTAGTNFKNYELLTFENGEMFLIEFAPKQEDEEEYKIVDVKVVPEEMISFFKHK
ncbi:hypothetical protein GS400_01255 [Pontibacillus sp. HMF3514]|nr:hypothetical protein GS400_01255 [Pontibacillus sp. HMF3514]